ncbi:MAG: hypothetical protein J9259_08845 [Thermoplasmata archaeon YP2-bin.285]|uniref:Uncharacterized protein n=1 Tax=Candidatus Sysuiplasma superficiale TaxID=2823368 RepID=A0A8J7YRM0_9ARCH|nr:hypothetical protein [Candidatus Sysuiplasma superficiale]
MLTLKVRLRAILFAIASYFILPLGPCAFLLVTFSSVVLLSYDAFTVTRKSIGLDELASFIVCGPLMMGGGFYAITGTEIYGALLASIPYGLGMMSILVGKYLDQEVFDRKIGQSTLPVLLFESDCTHYLLCWIDAEYEREGCSGHLFGHRELAAQVVDAVYDHHLNELCTQRPSLHMRQRIVDN